MSLKSYSHYHIGGLAQYFIEVRTVDVLEQAMLRWRKAMPSQTDYLNHCFILGGGTNVLFDDRGFSGLIVKPVFQAISHDDFLIRAEAGISVATLLDYTIQHSLSGLEWAGGLPGELGGALRGNAGAFGGEMKDVVVSVTSLDATSGRPRLITRTNAECQFGYRSSIFKTNDLDHRKKEIILSATLLLSQGERRAIRDAIEDKISYRRERHPIEYPNAGSIFKNVPVEQLPPAIIASVKHVIKNDPFPVLPVAYIIAESGLKGVSFGGAMISPKHPNFIVNVLNATAEDVKTLINLIHYTVKGKFGIDLEEEIMCIPY